MGLIAAQHGPSVFAEETRGSAMPLAGSVVKLPSEAFCREQRKHDPAQKVRSVVEPVKERANDLRRHFTIQERQSQNGMRMAPTECQNAPTGERERKRVQPP